MKGKMVDVYPWVVSAHKTLEILQVLGPRFSEESKALHSGLIQLNSSIATGMQLDTSVALLRSVIESISESTDVLLLNEEAGSLLSRMANLDMAGRFCEASSLGGKGMKLLLKSIPSKDPRLPDILNMVSDTALRAGDVEAALKLARHSLTICEHNGYRPLLSAINGAEAELNALNKMKAVDTARVASLERLTQEWYRDFFDPIDKLFGLET